MAINHKKIADLAGVSISTVSKALSGSAEISKGSAERIRKIAIECGYFQEKKRRKREYCNNESISVAILAPEIIDTRNSKAVTYLKKELEARGAHIAVYFYDYNVNKLGAVIEHIILSGAADGVVTIGLTKMPTAYNIPFTALVCDEEDCCEGCREAVDALLGEIAFPQKKQTTDEN